MGQALRSARNRTLPQPPSEAYMPFGGGLDQETPAWNVKKGRLLDCRNYEQGIQGGYQDIQGYERIDGRPKPSSAIYAILPVTITGALSDLDVLTGATSGATAVVAAVRANDGYVVLTKLSGTFQDGEDLTVSAVVQASAAGVASLGGAISLAEQALFKHLAANVLRADIQPVPGTGPVRGVFILNQEAFAWRDEAATSNALLYRATVLGWSNVPLGQELAFTGGNTAAIEPGMVITGATSGATATVGRIGIATGTVASSDAAGSLFLSNVSGTFVGESLDIPGQAGVATIAGAPTAIVQIGGGRYQFYASNFDGALDQDVIYGVDGKNRAFEFDGTTFAPIATGMPVDTPDHLIVHKQHLFLSYGQEIQFSGIGAPFRWELLFGADAFRTDGPVTGFKREPGSEGGGALGIFNRNRAYTIYGTSAADFNLVPYRDEVGAFRGTVQQLGSTLFFDDRGISNLKTSQRYGNFNHSTLSRHIQTWIKERRGLVDFSCIVREKNQYRLFYTDSAALYVTMEGDKVAAMMPCQLNHRVTCITSVEQANGVERILFGSTDGYVREMESGTSFDGENIRAYMQTHFTNDRIRWNKKYLTPVTIETKGTSYAELQFSYQLGYGEGAEYPQPGQQDAVVAFAAAGFWDEPGRTWDTLFWDGRSLLPTEGLELRGTSENVSFIFRKDSPAFEPVRMTGVHYRYLDRKGRR